MAGIVLGRSPDHSSTVRILDHPSPNFGDRRDGAVPRLVVLHHTAMATAEAALERLCDPVAEVSAHYLICERGRVIRMVDEAARAWHAGAGAWGEIGDVNSASIGIELANPAGPGGMPPFPEPQMAALEELLHGIMARWSIRCEAVIAHSDMAPDRKADPGPRFDWRRLAAAGLGVWPGPGATGARGSADADPQSADALWPRFQRGARAFGYVPPVDGGWEAVLGAVRLRFRPWAAGPLAAADVAVVEDLASRYPFLDAARARG